MSFPISQNHDNNEETILFDVLEKNKESDNSYNPSKIPAIDPEEKVLNKTVSNEKNEDEDEDEEDEEEIDDDNDVFDENSSIKQKAKSGEINDVFLKNPVANPIWLSVSEAAKIGGVNNKTIRRAIQSEKIKYKIYKDRYLIGLRSLIIYLSSNTKLKNKLNFNGIGQYVDKWRK